MAPARKRPHHEVSGQTLLKLVRNLKRKPAPSDQTVGREVAPPIVVEEDAVDGSTTTGSGRQQERPSVADLDAIRRCLLDWTATVQCAGLLKGDEKAAESILSPAGDNKFSSMTSSSQQAAMDAQQVLSSISHILNGGLTNEDSSLVALAAALLTAICDHIKSCPSPDDVCFLAEFELISNVAKPLLGSLLSYVESSHQHVVPAATSILSLLGPKLSRSTDLLNRWHDAVLRECDDCSGAQLIAALSFIGGKQIKPSELYGQTLVEYHYAIRHWIESISSIDWDPREALAIAEPSSIPQAKEELRVLTTCEIVKKEWIPAIKDAPSEEAKIEYFESRLRFMVEVVASLMRREVLGAAASAIPMLQQQLATRAMVDLKLVEDLLVTFRASARSLYSRTKKRLRSLTASNGVISIASTLSVVEVVQAAGHKLLDLYVSTIGASGLLPFSKRLERLSSEVMWLSSSTVVQNALEPTLQAKMRRDVHMPLRITSIRSYRSVVACFGRPPSSKRVRSNKVNRAMAVVCSTVVELLTTSHAPAVAPSEVIELLVAAIQTLQTCIDCGGDNLASSIRNLIDSVGYTCCEAIRAGTRHPLLCYREVRHATIQFARSILCVPYEDGSASSYELRRSIRLAAQVLHYDQDPMIASEASALLQVCKAISCSLRPTLHIVVKRENDGEELLSTNIGRPAEDLEEKIVLANTNLNSSEAESERRRVEKEKAAEKEVVASVEKVKVEPKDLSILFPADKKTAALPVPQAQSDKHPKAADVFGDSVQLPARNRKDAIQAPTASAKDDNESDDEMPMIVDCGPDEDDEE